MIPSAEVVRNAWNRTEVEFDEGEGMDLYERIYNKYAAELGAVLVPQKQLDRILQDVPESEHERIPHQEGDWTYVLLKDVTAADGTVFPATVKKFESWEIEANLTEDERPQRQGDFMPEMPIQMYPQLLDNMIRAEAYFGNVDPETDYEFRNFYEQWLNCIPTKMLQKQEFQDTMNLHIEKRYGFDMSEVYDYVLSMPLTPKEEYPTTEPEEEPKAPEPEAPPDGDWEKFFYGGEE